MRIFPIESTGHSNAAACGDESGEVPKLDLPLVRREFLKGSGVLVGTLATGSVLALLAPSPVWAVELKTLSKNEGQTLMAMGRVLFPHKKLPDAVYALLAKDLDAKASGDAAAATQLRAGIAALNQAAGGSFATAAPVRGQCVTSLYDNDMTFAVLGYPGSSFDKGGYITRGFQDLKWLPAPSREASPQSWAA